jgi:hypothetical protein
MYEEDFKFHNVFQAKCFTKKLKWKENSSWLIAAAMVYWPENGK